MHGKNSSRWRAVDADGMVLDILVQERRNQEAAVTFLQRLVEGYPDEPRVVVTDKLGSYGQLSRTSSRARSSGNTRA